MTITIADGRGALWQWDTGRRVKITDGVGVKQIHYQKRCFGRSVDVDVDTDGTAIIPDELLQDYHTLTAYAYVTDDAGGYTKVQQDFAVYKRPKPADYVYTPTEHVSFDRLRAEIGDLDDLTTADKSTIVAAINEAAASGGGGADWAQNDPDGDGYVANRPGGYMTDPVITDADAFTITSAEGGDGVYMAMVAVESSAITISDYVIGDGVVVDFGGQSYSLTWQSMGGFPACGAAVTGEAPDWSAAPFCIIAAFEKDRLQGYYVYLQNAVTSPIQVQIKKAKQTPVKIPTKYLESDVYIVKVTSKSNEKRPGIDGSDASYDVTVSATYDDIVAAINAGKIPILLGEQVLRDPVLCLVDISTDDVDGALPYLTFGGTYFGDPDRLYGTCVVIYRTGEATYSWYDSSFVNRLKDVDSAMSSTSLNPVQNWVIKKYVDDRASSDFVINATLDDNNNCTVDKTYAQIQEAVQAGKNAVMHLATPEGTNILPLALDLGGAFAFAVMFSINTGEFSQYTVSVSNSNAVFLSTHGIGLDDTGMFPQVEMDSDPASAMEIATKQYVDASGVPSVTAADNGKFLRVVNGAWAAAAINDANGVSF